MVVGDLCSVSHVVLGVTTIYVLKRIKRQKIPEVYLVSHSVFVVCKTSDLFVDVFAGTLIPLY